MYIHPIDVCTSSLKTSLIITIIIIIITIILLTEKHKIIYSISKKYQTIKPKEISKNKTLIKKKKKKKIHEIIDQNITIFCPEKLLFLSKD